MSERKKMAWLALLAGIGLQSVVTALLGLSMTPTDSLLMLALAAVACTLLGAVAAVVNRDATVARKPGVRALVWLNIWTAISFVAFFLGMGIHSAGVVFTLEASFAPLAVVAWNLFRVHRGDDQPGPSPVHVWPTCVLAVLGSSLVAVIAQSESGGVISLLSAAALGLIAGIAAGGVVIVSRGLGRTGVGVGRVMAHRFYATVVFAATILLTLIPSGMLAPPARDLGLIGAAALASIVAPLFLLQYAMQRLSPLSVTAALAAMPAITIAIELASGRPVTWIVLFLGVLIVPANLALIVRQRQRRPSLPTPLLSMFFPTQHRTHSSVTTV
jgi:drug/metabolite transporter (DMT)-like permease